MHATRMTIAEYKASGIKRAKYGNSKCVADGIKFDSKLEMGRYLELKTLRQAGIVQWFICQPPFKLPGGITYRADFLVVWAITAETFCDVEPVTIEDVKGYMTRVSLNKIRQVEEIYGITVQLITGKRKT